MYLTMIEKLHVLSDDLARRIGQEESVVKLALRCALHDRKTNITPVLDEY